MEPILQYLSVSTNTSFVAQTVDGSWFKTDWHQHATNEIILFTEGPGIAFIGNYTGKFETGDIFFIGNNLPHTFHANDEAISAVVIHFHNDYLGQQFMDLPECRHIKQLLKIAGYGLQFTGNNQLHLQLLIRKLKTATDLNCIILLLKCLQAMATVKEYHTLSTGSIHNCNTKNDAVIDRIYQFTLNSFADSISLHQVATIACMSVSAFCHYFKRYTQKTYIDFLNEVRISYACSQLLRTDKPVIDICYESGYNTVVHFHRQFLKSKGTTPLQFRKSFSIEIEGKDNIVRTEKKHQNPYSWSFN